MPAVDVPAGDAAAPDVGWVYREPEAVAVIEATVNDAVAEVKEFAAEARTVGQPAPAPDAMRVAMMAGMGVLAFGVLSTGIASLAVAGLITGPMFAARRLMAR